MNKIVISLIFATLTFNAMAKDKNEHDFEMIMLAPQPRPMFFVDGPMPPRHIMHNVPDFIGQQINLTDEQREKFRKLGDKHRKEIKQLRQDRSAMHERYQEKFEAVLTDEQFRKIEKMRKDLRRDMKKLDERQQDLFEQHRNDFESILTDAQRQQLHKIHSNKK